MLKRLTVLEASQRPAFCRLLPRSALCQSAFLSDIRAVGRPPADLDAAGAFRELCGNKLPYLGEEGAQHLTSGTLCPFQRGEG